ncbi:hypothetical protein HYQ44_005533 [Verticillium longisporum]|nr:hypothetical protein HYQ44_005533 [Verticillium longisporum]
MEASRGSAALDNATRATLSEKRSEKHAEEVTTAPIIYTDYHSRKNPYASLLYLPMELQFLIGSHLDYGDLQNLRCTNKFYRQLIDINFVRTCLGSLATDYSLRFVCRSCLRYDGTGRRLLWPLASCAQPAPSNGEVSDDGASIEAPPATSMTYCPDPSVPLAANCADCAVRQGQLCPGEYVLTEGGERKVRVCRWCGWPCTNDPAKEEYWPRSARELHPRCAQIYQMVMVGYYILVCIRSGIAFVTYILLWRLFADNQVVVVPSVMAFLLMGLILLILWLRGREVRTYHIVGSLEFTILGLGIPPLYVMIREMQAEYDAGKVAAEVLLIMHLIIRLINVLGNIVLFFEYDVTKHHAPGLSPLRRHLINPLIAGLVFWTSPRALENLWIGRGKHPRHKSLRRGLGKFLKNAQSGLGEFWLFQGREPSAHPATQH